MNYVVYIYTYMCVCVCVYCFYTVNSEHTIFKLMRV